MSLCKEDPAAIDATTEQFFVVANADRLVSESIAGAAANPASNAARREIRGR